MSNSQSPIPPRCTSHASLTTYFVARVTHYASICLIPFVSLLAIYLLTLAPTITWAHYGADGGDLVVAVVRGSIPHPPGFPTYLVLGSLFVQLPWRDPAWRLSLMSAVLSAGAAGLTVATVSRLQSAEEHPASAICAALGVGLAPLLWSQAVIVETYTLATFFSALVIFLVIHGAADWMTGLAWGVGLGGHPLMLFLAPLVVSGACEAGPKRLRGLTRIGLSVIGGWALMYGPVLLTWGDVPSPWGDVSTLEGWWALVSGRLYHRYLFALPPVAWSRRLFAWTSIVARQFTPAGLVLIGMGWIRLRQRRRTLGGAIALSVGALSLYAIGYDTADSLVYLTSALPLAAPWLGLGLAQVTGWLGGRLRGGEWLVMLLPLLQAVVFWQQMDVSNDSTAIAWAKRTLEEASPGAVVLTERDSHTFTLWYARDVLEMRPDVVVVDSDLWAQEPYRRNLADAMGVDVADFDLSPEEAARRAGRPIARIMPNGSWLGD